VAEPADPTVEQTTCLCGHPEHPDHDTEEPARICRTCQREDRHPAGCWGLFPQGSVAVEVDEHGQPVDDLHQAIQAASDALRKRISESIEDGTWWRVDFVGKVARVAVEAAWAALVDAHDHQAHLLRAMSGPPVTRWSDAFDLVGIEPATLERLEAKFRDALEQAWYDGRAGHPAPSVSRKYGYIVGEIKNLFHAAMKREARRLTDQPFPSGPEETVEQADPDLHQAAQREVDR